MRRERKALMATAIGAWSGGIRKRIVALISENLRLFDKDSRGVSQTNAAGEGREGSSGGLYKNSKKGLV